jgi:hypothetical protein
VAVVEAGGENEKVKCGDVEGRHRNRTLNMTIGSVNWSANSECMLSNLRSGLELGMIVVQRSVKEPKGYVFPP